MVINTTDPYADIDAPDGETSGHGQVPPGSLQAMANSPEPLNA